jgi:rRNA maturation endonuclease Nob1
VEKEEVTTVLGLFALQNVVSNPLRVSLSYAVHLLLLCLIILVQFQYKLWCMSCMQAFISQSKQKHSLSCGSLAIAYSQLAIASGFSWKGLLTGDDVISAIGKTCEGF